MIAAPRGTKSDGDGLLHMWDGLEASKQRDTSLIDLPACRALAAEAIEKAARAANIDRKRVVLGG